VLVPVASPMSEHRLATCSAKRIECRLSLVDAQLTLASLAALLGPGARAGAEALIELSARYRLRRVDELLRAWMRRHGVGEYPAITPAGEG